MSIYEAVSVSEEPEIFLSRWSVRRTSEGVLHLVGFNIVAGDGRVSTGVVQFDNKERTALTMSGRRYILVGPGGYDADAEYVWNWVVRTRKVASWRDVTSELVPDWKQAARSPEANSDLKSPLESLLPEEQGGEMESETELTAQDSRSTICGRLTAYRLEQADVRTASEVLSELRLEGSVANFRKLFRSEAGHLLAGLGTLLHAYNAASSRVPISLPTYTTVDVESLSTIDDSNGYRLASFDLVAGTEYVDGSMTLTHDFPVDLGTIRLSPGEGLWEIVAKFLLLEASDSLGAQDT